jgi:DNA polymerase-3 subunit alpha
MDTTDKVTSFIKECNEMRIKIIPPDINISDTLFSSRDKGINWGLGSIKNVGIPASNNIVRERTKNGKFTSLFDLTKRIDLRICNKRVLESLVKCGALDSFEKNRATLLASIDKAIEHGNKSQKQKKSGQISLFDDDKEIYNYNESYIKQDDFTNEILLKFEKEVLGAYVTCHPLDEYEHIFKSGEIMPIEELSERKNGETVTVGGLAVTTKIIQTKNNQSMAFMNFEDFTGKLEIVILPKVFDKVKNLLNDDELLIVKGRLNITEKEDDEQSEENIEIKITADEITSLKEKKSQKSKNSASSLTGYHIKVFDYQGEQLEEIQKIILNNIGDNQIYLHLEAVNETKLIKLGASYKAGNGTFINDVEKLLGRGSIWKV